jgi:amino acid adenylation domain-containing protein
MTLPGQSIADLSPEERRALLARLLREKAKAVTTTFPLSYGQQALYFTQQLAPESAAYNVAFAAHISSPIDIAALQRSFQQLIDRHAALRTSFVGTATGPLQVVAGVADLAFATVHAAALDDDALRQAVEAANQQPFDLAKGPLLRVHLFTCSASDHVLLVSVHHIVFDGWSMGLMLDELAALYRAELSGVPADLPPVARQFSDYVAWQNALLAGPEGTQLWAYWQQQLAGELPVLDLPIDRPRPLFQRFYGRSHSFEIAHALGTRLRALARDERSTLYTLFLAAFYALLHRISGQEDVIVGSPMAGRGQPEFQQTIGYLVSPLPLRVAVAGRMPFRELLARVRHTVHEALAHENYPFALMVEHVQPRREPGRTPIMEVTFTHQKVQILGKVAEAMLRQEGGAVAGTALAMEPYVIDQESGQFDLSLLLIEADDSVGVSLKYNSDLFEATTIERLLGYFQTLLDGIVADPDCPVARLPLLATVERAQVIAGWNATTADFPRACCLHDLLAAQAARCPETTAALFGEHSIRYGDLDARANQLAHHLQTLGLGPDKLVGIFLERSLDMLVALLGVLKAGAAYVPLDPAFPRERLALMLEDATAPLLITQAALAESIPAHSGHTLLIDVDWPVIAAQRTTAPTTTVQPEHLAYVIFTSGSTGRPKGVQIPHRAVVNFLNAMRVQPGLSARDTLLAVTTLSFDIAVLELYLPLLVGARVVLADRATASDGDALRLLMEQSGATVMQATPVTWKLLLASGWRAAAPFKALCGGEAMPPDLARALLAADVELWNMYGPTETTVWSTVQRVTEVGGIVPVGRPIDNTQIYVLNELLEPQPVGVSGELYIGGEGLARGYLKRPELTAERFVANPFNANGQTRLYRSGDLARWRGDGTIEVLGRSDQQVKIRGFRIELGEIEAALLRHPALREVVVVARDDGRGTLRLLAYLVSDSDQPPQAGALRVHLRATLPDYMIPAAFITLAALPLTPNGKIDRRALPLPEQTRARSDEHYCAPESPSELAIAAVWCEVLQIERVSAYDNFFDLGGHSLAAVETLSKLEQQLGPKLNPALLRVQTLGQLALAYDELLQARAAEATRPGAPPAQEQASIAGRLFGALRRAIPGGEKGREL